MNPYTAKVGNTRRIAGLDEYQEYAIWLQRLEKRAIIPLKWIILTTTLIIWLWGTHWVLPSPGVFALFLLYGMSTIALSYFFYFNRLEVRQIKSICIGSYFIDVLFIVGIVYADISYHYGTAMQADFYILYFLLILRGFALFRSASENMIVSALIAILFVITISLRETGLGFLVEQAFVLKFVLIWLVALMSWFIVDIINQQKAELMRIREKLIQTQHLSHLGEIAANVAHEINNPIGIIVAYSDLLLRHTDEADPHKEDFEIIRKEAMRCENIVRSLLNYAKPAAERIEWCNVEDINDEVLKILFQKQDEGKIATVKHYEPNLPLILADPEQLKQALVNVYLNAREAMDGSGTIETTIRTQNIDDKGDSHNIVITIHDSGKGLTREMQDRAFDPFFSTRESGTGLGLTITKQIIEGHKGTISLHNHHDSGAVVEIRLPISS